MINKKKFFDQVRVKPFGGRLSEQQVDGMTRILDYWEQYPLNDDLRHLAYMLATTKWETAHTMQPIQEKDNQAKTYLKSKPYYLWYGRGLVQLTWEDNYKLMDKILTAEWGVPAGLIDKPDLAKDWKYALPIMFEGMFRGNSSRGDFTGKSLEDYFNSKVDDPVNARRIINGTDAAEEIAGIHNQFLAALKASEEELIVDKETEDATKSPEQALMDIEQTVITFLESLGSSREISISITKIQECRLWAVEHMRKTK